MSFNGWTAGMFRFMKQSRLHIFNSPHLRRSGYSLVGSAIMVLKLLIMTWLQFAQASAFGLTGVVISRFYLSVGEYFQSC